jgi:hypothetical protein
MKYEVGDFVKVFFLSKWRIALIIENKEHFNNKYFLLICGEPDIKPQMYYEDEIWGKI